MLKTKDCRKKEIEKDRKRYDLIAISVTKPVVFVQTKFSPQYPTARGILGKWEIHSRSAQKRRETARGKVEVEAIDGRRRRICSETRAGWVRNVEEPKEKRQSEMEKDPPITVALVFLPFKAEGNPRRQSGISISTQRPAVRYLRFSRNYLTTKREGKKDRRDVRVTRYTSKVT